eukprot:550241-Rhodomonas_salina.1
MNREFGHRGRLCLISRCNVWHNVCAGEREEEVYIVLGDKDNAHVTVGVEGWSLEGTPNYLGRGATSRGNFQGAVATFVESHLVCSSGQ